jgi:GTP-binding protein HflX
MAVHRDVNCTALTSSAPAQHHSFRNLLLQVLEEIGVPDLPMITAWNKMDACANPAAVRALAASRPDVVAVSGATGEGLDELLEMVAVKLAENMVDMEVRVVGGDSTQ